MKRFGTFFLSLVIFLFLQGLLTVFSENAKAAQPLNILRITPKGNDVPAGRQIVIQFNRAVVPLGRMERRADELPLSVIPKLNCQWRWINTSALACQLGEKDALQPAHKYRITINPGIKAEDGATIPKTYHHQFITQRPKANYSRFNTWRSPGTPVIRVTFNQPVFQTSVEQHIYLKTGIIFTDRIPIQAEPDPNDRTLPRILPVPGEPYALDMGKPLKQKSDDQLKKSQGVEARRIWLVSPKKELPLDTEFELKVEPGLLSADGPEKGIAARDLEDFSTFPEFEFLGVSCVNNDGDPLLTSEGSLNVSEMCSPLRRVSLEFTSPVLPSQVKKHMELVPDLAGGRTDYDPWANTYEYSHLEYSHRGRNYNVTLPENLKAAQDYLLKIQAGTLKDEFGRTLKRPVDITFSTDHRKPDYNLVHRTAVLEKKEQTEVPLYVTNMKSITLNYKRLTPKDRKTRLSLKTKIPKVEDVAFGIPLGIREALGGQTGALYGGLDSKPHLNKSDYENTLFAQVTPFAVHVKLGHFNTLVWVTELATGKPVPGATVKIYKDRLVDLTSNPKTLTRGTTDQHGLATLTGTETLDPKLQSLRYSWYTDDAERLFVRVDKGGDMALLPLDEARFSVSASSVSQYSVYSNQQKQYWHMKSWGTTAQGVYKAGDTIQYKLYVRNQDNRTLVPPPLKGYRLEIKDPMGKKVHEVKDITLSEFGAYDGEFTVPKTGAVGWYWFRLTSNFTDFSWHPMRVLVSDFTPSPFRVSNELNGKLFQPGQPITVTTMARMHAGGPYTDAATRVTAQLKQQTFVSKNPVAKDFTFRKGYSSYYSTGVFNKTDKVDDKGNLLNTFEIKDTNVLYGTLMVESAVRDDRGKYVASATSAKYVGLDRFVGLKNTNWLYKEDETAKIQFIVVNEQGIPVKGTRVAIQIERKVTKASRVKGAGNAYLTQFTEQWVAAGKCSGIPATKPSTCRFTPKEPGSYRMTASIKDTQGRPHQSEIHAWVIGKGRVVWSEPDNNSLQIIPESENYKVGDKARYLIKNPFPGAKALVTIERYGILHSWVQTLASSTPVIEFPVKADYVPGYYLSVVVLSPRVDKPLGEGNVDLGKPTFRMGYVSVPVKDPYKEIVVTAKTPKETYRPRDIVKVSLTAKPRHKGKREPIELAVAVLDESVFDLIQGGSSYFDPYKGFYKLDSLDLSNFNILTGLIGRQKFEKKGANPGGGGGDDSGVAMRSLFKFVSYWNPSIKTDASGKAQIEFEVPDNLTGWRVLVLAVTPGDRMGLGEGNFKVNRATEVRPVMPNQVTEGDDFMAGFSVMNRTGGPRNVKVTIHAEGDIKGGSAKKTKTVSLKPYKRTTVWMPIKTRAVKKDRNHPKGQVRFKVTAVDKVDKDGLIHSLPVNKRRSLDTAANYGTTTQSRVEDSILFPKNIHTDVGSVSVVLSPSVIANVEGAFKYMRDYPYTCWEQVLSKGVMASHYLNLKGYVSDEFKWETSADLVKNTLESAASFQAPNGGMVYFVPQDRYVSPYLSAYTALAFNWLKEAGHKVPQEVEQKLHGYLENLLKRDAFPTFYNKGMSSTIRAVALAALAGTGRITTADLKRYQPHMPFMDLFGKTHYLQAALKLKGTGSIAKKTLEAILAHSSQTGGKFMFNETFDDSYSRILATPLRTNCAILSTLTQAVNRPEVASLVQDIPFKMVRAITQTRGNRDHWENTQENMFCMNALVDYSKAYENTKPKMTVKALMDGKVLGKVNFTDLRDPPTTLERPIGKKDPGRKTKMVIEKKGPGRMYYSTRVSYAPLEEHANLVNAGIEIRKEYSVERNNKWILLKQRSKIQRGELVRVDIFVSVPTARNFVVVDDPVPGGLEPVNRDLATASTVDADKGKFKAAGSSWWFQYSDWRYFNASRWSFYHKELRHDSVRFYSDYLPAGNYVLSYTAQAIAPGQFVKMPVHAEEMYDPDVYGKGIPSKLIVKD